MEGFMKRPGVPGKSPAIRRLAAVVEPEIAGNPGARRIRGPDERTAVQHSVQLIEVGGLVTFGGIDPSSSPHFRTLSTCTVSRTGM
jgi:hypothetical protein